LEPYDAEVVTSASEQACELFHRLHSLIDPCGQGEQYAAVPNGASTFSNRQVKQMTTLFMSQASTTKRHGYSAVIAVCLWANSVVSGST